MTTRIAPQTETRIVAMLARGDGQSKIIEELGAEGITVSKPTISNIKNRNLDALELIRNKVIAVETANTVDILAKSRGLIEKKLDQSSDLSVPTYLQKLLDEEKITEVEFADRFAKVLARREIALKDLTTVSKEMFNQTQIEAGRPTSITNSPELAKAQLRTLLEAINSGKEEDIVKAIFIEG